MRENFFQSFVIALCEIIGLQNFSLIVFLQIIIQNYDVQFVLVLHFAPVLHFLRCCYAWTALLSTIIRGWNKHQMKHNYDSHSNILVSC